jgi:hypothetical protein
MFDAFWGLVKVGAQENVQDLVAFDRRRYQLYGRRNQVYGKTRVPVNHLRFSGSPLPAGRGDSAAAAPVYIDSGFAVARLAQ